MKALYIKSTCDTPHVCLNHNKGLFQIVGRSVMEDATAFYGPIEQWVSGYASKPNPVTEFAFNFEYLNVESSKVLLDVIAPLKDTQGLTISWYSSRLNSSVKEVGEYLSELLGIPFVYKMITPIALNEVWHGKMGK